MADVASPEEQKTLWVGDIEQWMDETYVMNLFSHVGEVVNVKLIRDKNTMIPSGYGFVEFASHATAVKILENYNGTPIPNAGRSFRLNWATMGANSKTGGSGGGGFASSSNEFAIYIGDLSADVTDTVLQNAFIQRYPSVKNAKVVTDPVTGISKGYGFVRFIDENDKNRAMAEMQGQFIGARPIRISGATPKKVGVTTSTSVSIMPSPIPSMPLSSPPPSTQATDQNDPTNTTIFIGGLDPNVDEDTLRNTFAPFGELIYVKIPASKGCGFVQFTHRHSAESAFSMNGTFIGAQRVRLSWGKSPMAKPAAASSSYNNHNNNYYPYSYNHAPGSFNNSNYDYTSYYNNYMVPTRVIDFTLPPNINDANEEFVSESMLDQFTQPWLSRSYHGITPDPDGPDPLIVAL
eukprot:Phypoly_transcript_10422.p1 GENE.Phypoly_transcript_10422~~Phypoly_transcript_10422.p1  ORF type:complete len:417 (+),score=83.18 Phypoly_transcript_10422:35-1252(+)